MSRERAQMSQDDTNELEKAIDSASTSGGIVDLSTPIDKFQKGLPSAKNLAAAGLVLASLGGCVKPQETSTSVPTKTPPTELSPTQKPTDKPTEKPTVKPTETRKPINTPEPTPTIEVITYPKTEISEEFLVRAFSIGSGEGEVSPNTFATPTPGETVNPKMSIKDLVEIYASAGWDEKFEFQGLTDSPINVLKILVSIGTYTGVENGIYTPGGIDGQEILPLLSGTTFLRVRLGNVPSDSSQQKIEVQEGVFPSGLTLRQDTDMTVVGRAGNYEGTDWVLVSFTDWFRASKEGRAAPRQYFALIPVSLPGDPENKDAFTLQNLLANEGFGFKDGKVSFVDSQGKNAVWELNEVIGEDLQVAVREATGMFFVDQMNGELLANPVVRYPNVKALGLPEFWNAEKRTAEDGTVYFVITGATTQDETPVDLAKASYNYETEKWEWGKIAAEVEKPAWLPTVSSAVARFNETEKVWQYFSTDSQEQDQYIVSVREGEAGYEYFDYAEELRPILHPELFQEATIAGIRARMEETGMVKVLPCDISRVELLSVHRYPNAGNKPDGLDIFPADYPLYI